MNECPRTNSARGFSNGWLMAGRRRWQWRDDGAIPLSGHKISGHKSSTIRPPLIALVPVLRRGWYLVHDEIDCESLEGGPKDRACTRPSLLCLRWIWYTLVCDFFLCRRPTEYNFPFLLSRPLSRKNRAV